MAAPNLEFRQSGSPFAVLTTLGLTGSGQGGAVTLGGTSTPVDIRIYNNFAGGGGYGTAFNVTLASYDSETAWGSASIEPVINQWLQVKVKDYDGTTTGADTSYSAIGGYAKHISPVNSAQIAGAAAHYITVSVQVAVPLSTGQAAVSQGLWVEYTWT